MQTDIWVVKVGGRLCEDPEVRAGLARACAALNQPMILVHGGGAQVTALQSAFGCVPTFHEGRRVTGHDEMRVVEMALSGSVNKDMVRALLKEGRRAVGLSGCDGALVRCELVPDLGAVGLPSIVDVGVLRALLAAGYVPVLSSVSLGPNGEAVNVNADEMACAVAGAVAAERLLLLSDVSGVRVNGEDQTLIAVSDVERLINEGVATGGMVPKLRSAARAMAQGVKEVRIGGFAGGRLQDVAGTCIVEGR